MYHRVQQLGTIVDRFAGGLPDHQTVFFNDGTRSEIGTKRPARIFGCGTRQDSYRLNG